MHAIVRRYDGIDQTRTAELTKKVGEGLMPRLSKLPGFSGYYLIEAGNGVMSSIGLFDTPTQSEESNRVELDWDHLDAFGMPGVRTHHALNDNSRRLGKDMIAHGRQVLEAAGATSVRDFGLAPIWGWHLLGTARMGDDPKTSVADGFNRAHDVPNLFITDSSSMPTSGGVNPSSTIQALALRCADHIWERRREWSAAE